MGWFHSGKAASLSDSNLLIIWGEVIKLTASEGLAGDILILTEDANTPTDGHRCPFVVTYWGKGAFMTSMISYRDIEILRLKCVPTRDHDDTDASSLAELDGTHHLLTRRVKHSNAAYKGQISLKNKRKQKV